MAGLTDRRAIRASESASAHSANPGQDRRSYRHAGRASAANDPARANEALQSSRPEHRRDRQLQNHLGQSVRRNRRWFEHSCHNDHSLSGGLHQQTCRRYGSFVFSSAGEIVARRGCEPETEDLESAGKPIHDNPKGDPAPAHVSHRGAHHPWLSWLRRGRPDSNTGANLQHGEKPANTAPIRVDIIPGTQERYSGGGVTIEQQLIIDTTGKPFPDFMHETVLQKIGMTDSSYSQPLPSDWAARTAAGTYPDGKTVHGRWHIYPEMAAAGLWTTPTDLAKFAIEIALSKQGKANHVLSQQMTNEMLTPVMDGAALGFFLDQPNPGLFGHSGADEGFQALLTMNASTGKGLVIMANSDLGLLAGQLVLRKVADEYSWNQVWGPQPVPTLLLLAKARGSSAALQRYATLKASGVKDSGISEETLNNVGYLLLQEGNLQDAIAIFQRNVREYPQSSNVYDSLGESYMNAGQKDLAIANYEKSLQLDPKNENAVRMLKKLKESK